MSAIENVITTTFRARGGNVISQLGSYAQGFGRIGQVINQNTSMSERLNNQWRAIGTTIRYAIAGTAVFGLQRMVQQLNQVNQQLGQMQALSDIGTGNQGGFSDAQITRLGNRLQSVAVNTITPINDVNEAAVNFLSTVQDVKPSQLPQMLQQISRSAKLAQTPVEDLTQAATTMQIAFGRSVNPQSIGQFSRMWQTLIGLAPGGITAAPTIAQSMPGLASMFQLAPGKAVPAPTAQAQMMALTLGVLRTGMPAATGMRGLTYLLQSIAQPTGHAGKALAGIGVTPQLVQQQGIFAALMKVLQTITNTGNPKQLAAIPDDTMDQLDTSGGNLPGIPAAEMSRLRQMIPRIHGIRAAIILASQLMQKGDVSSLEQDVNRMLDAQNQNSQAAQQLSKSWQDLAKRSKLQQASIAVNQMALEIAQSFSGPLGYIANQFIGLSGVLQKHRTATHIAAGGAAAFLGLMGVNRLVGGIPGIGKFIPGGGAFVKSEAANAVLSGASGLGATPLNPLYVIVVGQIFNGYSGGGGSNTLKTVEQDAEKVGKTGFWGTVANKVLRNPVGRVLTKLPKGAPEIAGGATAALGLAEALGIPLLAAGDQASNTETVLQRARQLFGKNVSDVSAISKGMFKGRADVYLTLEQKDANGKITNRKVHIPVDMWQGGRHPSTQGHAGKGTRSH